MPIIGTDGVGKKKRNFHTNNSLVRALTVKNVQGEATKFAPTAPVPLESGCAKIAT